MFLYWSAKLSASIPGSLVRKKDGKEGKNKDDQTKSKTSIIIITITSRCSDCSHTFAIRRFHTAYCPLQRCSWNIKITARQRLVEVHIIIWTSTIQKSILSSAIHNDPGHRPVLLVEPPAKYSYGCPENTGRYWLPDFPPGQSKTISLKLQVDYIFESLGVGSLHSIKLFSENIIKTMQQIRSYRHTHFSLRHQKTLEAIFICRTFVQ